MVEQKIRSKKIREFVALLEKCLKERVTVYFYRHGTVIAGNRWFHFAKIESTLVDPFGVMITIKISKMPYSIDVSLVQDYAFLKVWERKRIVYQKKIKR